MIICHCNVICSERIRTAVSEALEDLPAAAITPATVYERCRRAPDCGGCQFAIRRIIRDMVAERERESARETESPERHALAKSAS